MSLGPWQLIIIALVVLVLFGRGRISEMMGDFGKGIKSFKQGMNEEEPTRRLEHDGARVDTAEPKAASDPTETK